MQVFFANSLLRVPAAMVKHSWPFAVTSWEDTVKFAQLLFGKDVRLENYSSRLPFASEESFLLFAKGACKDPCPFSVIGQMIAAQLEEVAEFEKRRGNEDRCLKSQEMGGRRGSAVYYYSSQITCELCTCRVIFGADAHHRHIPTNSGAWQTGSAFRELLQRNFATNFKQFGNTDQLPVWMEKSWQVLFNKNDHNRGHGITPHSDNSSTYAFGNPITSFSFGHGGVLTLESVDGRKGSKKKCFRRMAMC